MHIAHLFNLRYQTLKRTKIKFLTQNKKNSHRDRGPLIAQKTINLRFYEVGFSENLCFLASMVIKSKLQQNEERFWEDKLSDNLVVSESVSAESPT